MKTRKKIEQRRKEGRLQTRLTREEEEEAAAAPTAAERKVGPLHPPGS
jgi:hypothetical protein